MASYKFNPFHRQLVANNNMRSLVGKRFGKLTGYCLATGNPNVKWLCNCDCGKTRIVEARRLTGMEVKDCGHCGETETA